MARVQRRVIRVRHARQAFSARVPPPETDQDQQHQRHQLSHTREAGKVRRCLGVAQRRPDANHRAAQHDEADYEPKVEERVHRCQENEQRDVDSNLDGSKLVTDCEREVGDKSLVSDIDAGVAVHGVEEIF